MLHIRIVRGPLERHKNEEILREYNRLTSARIPLQEFNHWVQDSPAGPAWHAFLETDDGAMAGHNSFIPFHGTFNGGRIVPAKSEYSFLREEFRTAKIRGFENSTRPAWLIFADRLHQHCIREGWGPLLISTTPAMRRWGPSNRCYPADIQLWECLLVLRPWRAARKTPNLDRWHAAGLCLAGMLQRAGWSVLLPFCPGGSRVRLLPIENGSPPKSNGSISFFQDPASLRWRYLEGQYERLALDPNGEEYVIVKKGSSDRYLRVCQWRLEGNRPILPLLAALVRKALEQGALGVRWAIYGQSEAIAKLASRVRSLGFLRVRRVRTLLIHTPDQQFLSPEKWNLTDAMFSFDP